MYGTNVSRSLWKRILFLQSFNETNIWNWIYWVNEKTRRWVRICHKLSLSLSLPVWPLANTFLRISSSVFLPNEGLQTNLYRWQQSVPVPLIKSLYCSQLSKFSYRNKGTHTHISSFWLLFCSHLSDLGQKMISFSSKNL